MNQSAFLGDRNESIRRDLAELWMAPPRQSFESNNCLSRWIDLRLIVHMDLAPPNGAAQLIFQREALSRHYPQIVAEILRTIPTVPLGRIHGAVCLPQQIGAVLLQIVQDADADTGTNRDLTPLHIERARQAVQ